MIKGARSTISRPQEHEEYCGCFKSAIAWFLGESRYDMPHPASRLQAILEEDSPRSRMLHGEAILAGPSGSDSPSELSEAIRLRVNLRKSQLTGGASEIPSGITSLRLQRDPHRNLHFRYEIVGDRLGDGGYAEVYGVRDLYTGEMRAAKRVAKDLISDNLLLRRELETLLTVDHPHVVRLFEWFETADAVWMIQELLTGGELLACVGKCSAREALGILRQILLGVSYLHDRGIIHRDMKLENCMFQLSDGQRVAKIIDFGLAGISRDDPALQTHSSTAAIAGTALYIAPELVSAPTASVDAEKCDMWAVGILAYILLTGEHPFWDKSTAFDQPELHRRISTDPIDFTLVQPESASLLLRQLLDFNPTSRLTARAALMHPCMRVSEFLGSSMHSSLLCNLRSFSLFRPIERVTLTLLAYHSTSESTAILRELFALLDTDMNGVLSRTEITAGMLRVGLEIPADFDSILDSIDADQSGSVDYTEFVAAALDADQVKDVHAVDSAFAWLAVDRTTADSISEADLEGVVGAEEAAYTVGKYGDENRVLTRSNFNTFIQDISDKKLTSASQQQPPCE